MALLLDRRAFLAGAGSSLLSGVTTSHADMALQSDALFASAMLKSDGTFGAAVYTESGEIVRQIDLPARGHDVAINPVSGKLVVFARRPGTFAIAFGGPRAEPFMIASETGRHFYGHGVFSNDGKLLFATENDFENAAGKIGVYDATSDFQRVGEFDSYGMGPHEMALLPDGKTLVVANGGIETHPDFGRQKLNLATMRSLIVMINVRDGHLIAKDETPLEMRQLSLRHMSVDNHGDVFIGAQSQKKNDVPASLLWRFNEAQGLEQLPQPRDVSSALRGYVGSIEISSDGRRLAVSSPVAETILTLDARTGKMLSSRRLASQGSIVWNNTALAFDRIASQQTVDNHAKLHRSTD
jgi:hypothetical protein